MKHVNINPTIFIRQDTVAPSDDSTWLSDEDYKNIRRGIKKTARSFRRGELDETKMSSRGIEHLRSAEDLERQIINKDCAIGVVLSEQRRLVDAGTEIADAAVIISKAYRMHTRWARQNALHLAACDEAFVQSNVDETARTISSPTPAADIRSSNYLNQLSSLGIDDDESDDCVGLGVTIQQRSRGSSPCPIAWMDHQDSLRLSDIKDRNRGTIAENKESGLEEAR